MWSPSLITVLSSVLLASSAFAQRYTTTLPFLDGDTLVVSAGTNALGLPTTVTLSTITATGTLATVPTLTTLPTTTATRTTTTNTRTRTTQTTANGPDTTMQRVVGQDTTAPPMRTTTYWYDPGNGVWTVATWTASVTAAPQVATVNVPSGTIQDYNSYQTVVNSAVLSAAQSADVVAAKSAGHAQASFNGVTGLAAMLGGVAVGAVGLLAF